jgi:hypothetical protein
MDNSNRLTFGRIGATGSGKGVSIRNTWRQDKPIRLLIWDPLNEYGRTAKTVRTLGEAKAARSQTIRRRFNPGPEQVSFSEVRHVLPDRVCSGALEAD